MFLRRLGIKSQLTSRKIILYLLYLSLAFAAFSFWWFRFQGLKIKPPLRGRRKITLEFVLKKEPRVKGPFQYFSYRHLIIGTLTSLPLHYGDRLLITGFLEPGKTFLVNPEVKVLSHHGAGWLFENLYQLRIRLSGKVESLFPEPQASLLKGIVLGIRSELPESFYNQLKRTGTLHVVVASGYNITLLGKVVLAATRFLGRRASLVVTIISLFLYSFLAGAEPPIMRAFFMGSLVCFGDYLGRPISILRVLVGSAVIMLMLDPLLIEDLSFQLSFLATFSLCAIVPLLKQISNLAWLEDFWASLASQIMVWPLVAYHFKTVSFWAPLTNLLILWSVEPAMIVGLLPIIIPKIFRSLSLLAVFFPLIPLTYFVEVAKLLSHLPGSLIYIDLTWFWVVAYYSLVLFFLGLNYVQRNSSASSN